MSIVSGLLTVCRTVYNVVSAVSTAESVYRCGRFLKNKWKERNGKKDTNEEDDTTETIAKEKEEKHKTSRIE